ncbi:MAG TPA: DUF2934 domain-containing protein [Nitrospira sp.]|nr:DUF2934 domain-containing protein [Nitrospira sp.]
MARLKAKETSTTKPKKTESPELMIREESEGSDYAEAPPPSRPFSWQDRRIQDIESDEADVSSDDALHYRISERAYLLYEASGFKDGNHLQHWLEAERQIKTLHV